MAESVKMLLDSLGVRARKGRGQNFLLNPELAAELVRQAQLQADDEVVEIGPGLGAMTEFLLQSVPRLIAVEVEPTFVKHLSDRFAGKAEGFEVHAGDVRKLSLTRLGLSKPCVVVSNVPYSISSEIVFWLIAERALISRAQLLFQREFAQRLAAKPGCKSYGSLSVWLQLYAELELGSTISGKSFFPATEVESRVLKLRFLPGPRYELADATTLEKVLRAAFGLRRKQLGKAFAVSKLFSDRSAADSFLLSEGIDPNRRGETLSVLEFVSVSNALKELHSA